MVIAVIGLLILIGIYSLKKVRNNNEKDKQTAIEMAKNYLQDNYEQEMVYESYSSYFVENRHFIHFYQKMNSEIKFTVYVTKSSKSPKLKVWKDDYFESIIKYELKLIYQNIADSIWKEDINISVLTTNITSDYPKEYFMLSDIDDDIINDNFIICVHTPYFLQKIKKLKQRKYISLLMK